MKKMKTKRFAKEKELPNFLKIDPRRRGNY